MTATELIQLSSHKVRNSEPLMRLYIERFKAVFGYEPNCAACTFNSDWNKFTRRIRMGEINENSNINLKSNTMATEKKFQLKRQHSNDILSYRDGKKTHRIYGRLVNDEFAENFLKKGTKEQIAQREKMFEVTPKTAKNSPKGNSANAKENAGKGSENSGKDALAQIQALTLEELPAEVDKITNIGDLEKLRQIEKKNGDRVGANEIIDARKAALQAEETVENTTTPPTPENVNTTTDLSGTPVAVEADTLPRKNRGPKVNKK